MRNKIITCCSVVLVLSVVWMVGCSQSGVKRSQKTLSSAESLRADFEKFKGQIDRTMVALGAVETGEASKLKSNFKKYGSEVKKLDSQSKKIITEANDLVSKSRSYIEAWEKQLSDVRNPELRTQAEQRRASASAELENAKDELRRIRGEYDKFYTSLNEIRITLENDLNPAGVAAVGNVIATTRMNAQPLKNDIDTIIAGLDEIIGKLSGTQ